MIDLIAAAGIGGIIGMGIMAWRTHGKVSAAHYLTSEMLEATTRRGVAVALDLVDAQDAHARCADALGTTQRKLSSIRDLVGPTEGLRRGRLGQIAAILDGERV